MSPVQILGGRVPPVPYGSTPLVSLLLLYDARALCSSVDIFLRMLRVKHRLISLDARTCNVPTVSIRVKDQNY